MKALQPLCSLEALLQPPLKAQLVRYLRLEQRCGRWYSLSCHYFRQAAAECAAQLAAAAGEQAPAGNKAGTDPKLDCAREPQEPGTTTTDGEQGERTAAEAGQQEPAPVGALEAGAREAAAWPSHRKPGSRRSSRHSTPVDGDPEAAAPAADVAAPKTRRSARNSHKQQQQQPQQLQKEQQQQQEGEQQALPEQQQVPNGLKAAVDASEGSEVPAAAAAAEAEAAANDHKCQERTDVAVAAAQIACPLPGQLPATALEAVAVFVSEQTAAVEREVYAMPAGDGVAVPELFAKAAEGQLEDEFVELLD